jgi:hypothetical protein
MGEFMLKRIRLLTIEMIAGLGCLLCTQAFANDLSQINAPAAWAVTTDCRGSGSSMVVIVVFGNGTNRTLPQFTGNILSNPIDTTVNGVDEDHNGFTDDVFGWDFWHNNNNTFPETSGELYPWHDTVVAGIMAANGSGGVSGVCPNAFVYVLKKDLDDDFYSSPAVVNQVITGLNYAINLKSELQTFSGKTVHMVINNSYAIMHSLADWNSVPQLKTAIDAAAAAHIGMFFAATNAAQSNDNPAKAAYPASYASPNIVSVGAVDASDHISSVSNFGNAVHIAAPGVGINMVLDTGQIGVDLEGTQGFTSFATPHVTAAAAMYWSQHPNASFAQVKAALLNTADNIPGLPVLNGNRLNLGRLIAGTSISPDGMIISGGTGSLITSAGTWTFGGSVASGEWSILLNGSSAGGGIGSKMEVSNGGKLYALGTDGNWYLWTGSTWTPGSPQGATASPDGTIISGGTGSLTTSAGTWTFGGSVASGEWSILLNGSSAGGGAGSKMEVSNGGKLYALGTDGKWYLWTGSTWTPGTPTGSNPPSACGTAIPPANQIVDGDGNVWTVTGGKSYVNGVPDGAATIVTLLWYNGVLYLYDQGNSWFSHASGRWVQIAGDPRG